MHYTLHQLQIFTQIAEHRSITKAAEAMHLTQPAVSIQLKKFQEQFDVPLVEVIGRKLYITPFGEQIVDSCKRILEEIQHIERQTEALKGHLVGEMRISAVSTAKYIAPYFLTEFLKEHPSVELQIDVTNKTQVVKHLEKNEVDFALVSVLPENLSLKYVKLMENRLYLIGKKQEQEHGPLEELPLILREPGSATRQAMLSYLRDRGISKKMKMELTSNEATKQAVLADLGYSIMPLIGLRNELANKQLEIIPQPGLPIVTNWHLVWLKEKKLSPIALAYLDFIEKRKEAIISQEFEWHEKSA